MIIRAVISSEAFFIVLGCDWHENNCDVYDGDDGTVLLCSVFQASFDEINATCNGKSYVFGKSKRPNPCASASL